MVRARTRKAGNLWRRAAPESNGRRNRQRRRHARQRGQEIRPCGHAVVQAQLAQLGRASPGGDQSCADQDRDPRKRRPDQDQQGESGGKMFRFIPIEKAPDRTEGQDRQLQDGKRQREPRQPDQADTQRAPDGILWMPQRLRPRAIFCYETPRRPRRSAPDWSAAARSRSSGRRMYRPPGPSRRLHGAALPPPGHPRR